MNTVDSKAETLFTQDMSETTSPSTFQVGSIYSTGRGDYEWTYKVIARTARFITIEDVLCQGPTRVGVSMSDGEEYALPCGHYSQAPVIRAGRVVV